MPGYWLCTCTGGVGGAWNHLRGAGDQQQGDQQLFKFGAEEHQNLELRCEYITSPVWGILPTSCTKHAFRAFF